MDRRRRPPDSFGGFPGAEVSSPHHDGTPRSPEGGTRTARRRQRDGPEARDYLTWELHFDDQASHSDRAAAHAVAAIVKAAAATGLPNPDEFEVQAGIGLSHSDLVEALADLAMITSRSKDHEGWERLIKRLEVELGRARE